MILNYEIKSYKLQAASYKLQAASCKLQAASCKLQASSLTGDLGYCKIIIERYIMNEGMENLKQIEELENNPLNRIADAMEEILRLVKKDMEKYEKKNKK